MANKHPLQVILERNSIDIRSYSGRGMFGKSCLGATVKMGDQGDLFATIIRESLALALEDEDEASADQVADAMESLSWDSMGLDMIVYWTRVPFVDDPENAEDEDEDTDDE